MIDYNLEKRKFVIGGVAIGIVTVEKLSQQLNHIEEFTFGNICSDNTNTKKA